MFVFIVPCFKISTSIVQLLLLILAPRINYYHQQNCWRKNRNVFANSNEFLWNSSFRLLDLRKHDFWWEIQTLNFVIVCVCVWNVIVKYINGTYVFYLNSDSFLIYFDFPKAHFWLLIRNSIQHFVKRSNVKWIVRFDKIICICFYSTAQYQCQKWIWEWYSVIKSYSMCQWSFEKCLFSPFVPNKRIEMLHGYQFCI